MWRILASVRRNLQNMLKSPRVADETAVADAGGAGGADLRRRPGGISAVYGIYRASASVLACFSGPRVSGTDGVWASGEFGHASELNHLMVSDSMRYAILM